NSLKINITCNGTLPQTGRPGTNVGQRWPFRNLCQIDTPIDTKAPQWRRHDYPKPDMTGIPVIPQQGESHVISDAYVRREPHCLWTGSCWLGDSLNFQRERRRPLCAGIRPLPPWSPI